MIGEYGQGKTGEPLMVWEHGLDHEGTDGQRA